MNTSETQSGTSWAVVLPVRLVQLFSFRCHGLPLSSVKSNSRSVIKYNYIVFLHAVNIIHEALRIRRRLLVLQTQKTGLDSKEKSPISSEHHVLGNKSLRWQSQAQLFVLTVHVLSNQTGKQILRLANVIRPDTVYTVTSPLCVCSSEGNLRRLNFHAKFP